MEEFLKKAFTTAKEYQIEYDINDNSDFIGCCTELPIITCESKNLEECENNIRKSIQIMVAYMIKNDMELPSPVSQKGYIYS